MRYFAGDVLPELRLGPTMATPWVLPSGLNRQHRSRLVNLLAAALRGADPGLRLSCPVRTQAYRPMWPCRTSPTLGEQLDHPGHGIRAVHSSSGASQYLDAFDLLKRYLLPRCTAGGL